MELFLQFFPNFLLIFCRISSFLITAPVFSTRNVPATFKIGLAFFISLIAFALVGLKQPTEIDGLYFLQVLKEVLIGLLIGFAAYMFIPIPFASLKTQNGMKSVSLERFFCILKLQGYQYTTNHAEVSGPPLVQGDRMFICVDCLSKHK